MATLTSLTFNDASGFLKFPSGDSDARPSSPSAGSRRFDETYNEWQTYNGSEWVWDKRSFGTVTKKDRHKFTQAMDMRRTMWYDGISDNLTGLSWSGDGKHLYLMGNTLDAIHHYDVPDAWNPSSVQTSSVTTSGALYTGAGSTNQETAPQGLFVKPDGTKLWFAGVSQDTVTEYTMSTPHDLTTMSYSTTLATAVGGNNLASLSFKPDGSKFYYTSVQTDDVFSHTLSTAWDLSTASTVSAGLNCEPVDTTCRAHTWSRDGKKLFIGGNGNDRMGMFECSTPWDQTTGTLIFVTPVVYRPIGLTLVPLNFNDMFMKPSNTSLFAICNNGQRVHEFTLE